MEKQNIVDIFLNGSTKDESKIIKSVNINIESHKKGLLNIYKSIYPDFIIDYENEKIIEILFNYFIGNKEFCGKNNIDLNKGIFICGGVGTGKSLLMEGFKSYCGQILKINGFQGFTAMEIVDNVNISGITYLENFNTKWFQSKANPITCYIDDIASKNEKINNYGTVICVIEQLISIRYNIYIKYKKLTHFSTNIFPSNLKEYYDERIIDRLKEMCNIVSLTGISRRK